LLKKRGSRKRPDKLDVKPFKGDPKDLRRFVYDVESKLDYYGSALRRDMDKIRLVVPLLEGPAKSWYEGIHPHINRHAAQREGIPFDKDSPYRKWSSFFDLIRTSFGQSLSRDLYVVEWERIKHQDGKIDEFLDKLGDLMWKVGYSGEAIKDKIKSGLTSSLRRSWAAVQHKPENVSAYMGALREFAHQIEDDDRYEKRHSSNRTSNPAESSGGKRKKEKKEKKNKEGKEHAARSSSQKDTKSGKKNSSGFKDKDKELKGIPEALREDRRKSSVCLKCGKAGHSWFSCYTKEPVTRAVSTLSKKTKRKREEAKETEEPKTKKPKVERVKASPRREREVAPAAKEVAEAEAQPPVSPPRIFEIEDEASDTEMY
jgi:hypothetical protein